MHAAQFEIRLFIFAEWFRTLRQHSTILGIGFATQNSTPQTLRMHFRPQFVLLKPREWFSYPAITFFVLTE